MKRLPTLSKLKASALDMRLKGGAMTTIYIGVDFHARTQTLSYLTTEGGEVLTQELKHQDKEAIRTFYAQFKGHVVVGLEASGYSPWFEELLEELGCEVWLGDATEIHRRGRWRQKNDRRDAELILDLMLQDQFPRLHRPVLASREILRMLRFRHKLIKIRTISKNSLQALALQAGLAKRSQLWTKAGQQELGQARLSAVSRWQCEQWQALREPLDERLAKTMTWLKRVAADDERIARLRTQPGIGLLTSLCVVHSLMPVSRFRNQRKVTAYAGFDPMERSSAERKRFLGISKAGSRVLRHLLTEAAQTAARHDEGLKRFYERLAARRGRPKAKVAVARKLLVRSYIMLRDEIDYAEFHRRAVAAQLARRIHKP
jgi:transposase